MLELKNVKKTYQTESISTKALDDVSVAFREKEFVAILGASGSGKTTFLNVIGGLDRYDSGDVIIKGKSTKDFRDSDWDAYRNNSIGFVFQSYNLIGHINVIDNVEMGMTLSGISAREKRERAFEALDKVGLRDQAKKRPNQLSGGQMQRVAIARALANDPEILLCDEPTGALDTKNSLQIMELIKELSKERLVIMVTHNPELADRYADRIIQFSDGQIVADNHPHDERPKEDAFRLNKTHMRFSTAVHLSFNNIRTKKWRTFLTSFASSIGIIGIAVILSLSSGFNTTVQNVQADAMSQMPITISRETGEVDMEAMQENHKGFMNDDDSYTDRTALKLNDPSSAIQVHTNAFTDEFLNYLNSIDPKICNNIGYLRLVSMNLLRETGDGCIPVAFSSADPGSSERGSSSMNMENMGISVFPSTLDKESTTYLEKNYELIAGDYPASATDVVLVVGTDTSLNRNILLNLGFDVAEQKEIAFDQIVGTEMKIVSNDDYYQRSPLGNFLPSMDYAAMYASEHGITIRISGIVRVRSGSGISVLKQGIAYSDALSQQIIDMQSETEIVIVQSQSDRNVITATEMDDASRGLFLETLGAQASPYIIMLYPETFEKKDQVVEYLDEWNSGKSDDDKIAYTDMAATMSQLTGGVMNGITIVLIAFAAISLVVSMIMICIIIYTSVLERTKEIGILRALGARKRDITRVFDAETFILGLFSGVLGVGIGWLLTFPINRIIYKLTELKNVAHLPFAYALLLIAISTVLTILGGHIPARMAAKKDAVEALRSE